MYSFDSKESRENHSNIYLAVPLKFILNSLGCCIFPKGITICFVLFQLTLLFREVLGSQQKWATGTEISHMLLPQHMHSLPHSQHSPPEWYICYNRWAYNHYRLNFIVYNSRVHSLENPMDGGAWWAAVHGVAKSQIWLSDFTFTFHFHALEKEMATHSSVLAWRIPGTGEPDGLPSVGSHRVGHNWRDLAAAAAATLWCCISIGLGKCVMMCICHESIIQTNFSSLEILCAPHVLPPFYPKPSETWYFCCLRSFAFSRWSYLWNYIVYRFFIFSFTN